ncbi:MAG: class I SAM-dependent methyltransferase [Candidatus Lokiarchaeota archaeon]|nr:class I SAM-dependent methyltransferase [Candidatus Lokiarchaeota archaeon]
MDKKTQHYSTQSPDVRVKVYSVSESLKQHLYLFKTITGVFSFKQLDLGTKVFIEHINIPEKECVLLDMGCGYGAIGIVLAQLKPQSTVYLTDINKRALWCARENIKYNLTERSSKVIVLQGSYFKPFENKSVKFDGIYMNPPLRNGRREFLTLCEDIPRYLKSKGLFQFVIKKKMGAEYIHNYLNKNLSELFDIIEVTFKRSGYWIFYLTSF